MFRCFSKHVALISLIALFIAGCCNPPSQYSLQVTLHPQETSVWCWAACGQMIMDYLGHNVTQCVQAHDQHPEDHDCPCDACSNPPTGNHPCIATGWPKFETYGFSEEISHGPLSWDQIKNQIYCKRKPFAFSWKFGGEGGHMMVAKGYSTVNGENYVDILDPEARCCGEAKFISYDAYVHDNINALPQYTHWDDYYDITYRGGN